MTLINTLNHILRHYYRVFFDSFPSKLPSHLQIYQNDCEDLVGRYNILLKKISEYMKDHCKQQEEMPHNSDLIFSYHDTDSFFLISIKEDLETLQMIVKSYWKKVNCIHQRFNCTMMLSNKI